MGYGSSENYVKKVAQQIPNIHFQAAVPQKDIIQYTSSADVGIFYIPSDNISLSYRYSLPNKFFEYLIGGLPVMISDNLEYLSELIKENDLGWILSRNNEAFINFINSLTQEQINAKLENGFTYSRKSGWQFEESILKEIYS
jgi:glycosyltransferase involved in cell wall biosynthesis